MKKHIIICCVILLLLPSSFIGASKQIEIKEESTVNSPPMDSAWPMYGHDARHTFQSQYNTDNNPGIEKWRYRLCREFGRSSPVIDKNGIIYVGTNIVVFSLFSNGTLNWRRDVYGGVGATIAIDKNGILYVPTYSSYPSYFYALDLNGSIIWKYQQGWESDSSPAIAEDGTIYFGDESEFLYALNPDGTLKWRYKTDGDIHSSPAIDGDGLIYFIDESGFLYALKPDGKLKWKKDNVHRYTDVSIDENGTIYYLSDGLYAVNSDGSLIWNTPVRRGTTPAISNNGIIYIGYEYSYPSGENTTLKAFNSENGDFLWLFNPGNKDYLHISTPAISADGILYLVANVGDEWGYKGGEIISLNPDGTLRWRDWLTDHCALSIPTIAEDGTVYVISNQGYSDDGCYIHAFGSVDSNSPPGTPTISGETFGEEDKKYSYSFIAIDFDRNPIRFYIDWGDGTTTGWTKKFASDESYYFDKTWNEPGNYTIRAKVQDTLGEESDWGELNVTMKKDKATNNVLLLRLLERFPMLERLLGFLTINIK